MDTPIEHILVYMRENRRKKMREIRLDLLPVISTRSIYEETCTCQILQPTKEQLIEAANRLLNCFENLDRWPKLSVALSKKTWYVASVDDTTREAIRRLCKQPLSKKI